MAREAKPLDIICPQLRTVANAPLVYRVLSDKYWGEGTPTCVSQRSPKTHKRAVETIARYFKREEGYDFVQYDASEKSSDDETLAFIWTDGYEGELSVVGACCFRWREWENLQSMWAMQWIWLHPYFRRKGLLTKAWPLFCDAFGPFHVESPLSRAMSAFLEKQVHSVIQATDGHGVHVYGAVKF